MNAKMLGLGVLAVIFAVFEYHQHKEFNQRHDENDRCPSGVVGFVFLAVALIGSSFLK